jgi:hypothetical protein
MLDFDLYDFYENAKDKKIILSFKGTISQQILIDIGEIIKARSETQKWTKKIFSVFVELSQNIMHYSEERELDPVSGKDYGVGIVLFHETTDKYIVTSGNIAKEESGRTIKEKVEKLNLMDRSELKKYYNEAIRMPRPDNSNGAGLGLIEIARKSSGEVDCYTVPLDDNKVFMVMSTYFNKEALLEV